MQIVKVNNDINTKLNLPVDILRFYSSYKIIGNISLVFDNYRGFGYGNQITKFLYLNVDNNDYYGKTQETYSNWEDSLNSVLDYFPFAETLGASCLLISKLSGNVYGYMWEVGINETLNNPDYYISNSFTEFLEKLIKENNITDPDFLEMYGVVKG